MPNVVDDNAARDGESNINQPDGQESVGIVDESVEREGDDKIPTKEIEENDPPKPEEQDALESADANDDDFIVVSQEEAEEYSPVAVFVLCNIVDT